MSDSVGTKILNKQGRYKQGRCNDLTLCNDCTKYDIKNATEYLDIIENTPEFDKFLLEFYESLKR